MIDPSHTLPVIRQCALLDLSRSSVYYTPQPVAAEDLALMRRIDELHLNHPFAGARMLRALLALEGLAVGRRHADEDDGHRGVVPASRHQPETPQEPGLPVPPARTRHHPREPGVGDGYYLHPDAQRLRLLAAVLDWATRRVLSWRLSNTLTTDFCLEAVEDALAQYGTPTIFNTDQGSQFSSTEFVDLLRHHGMQQSMDGKGRWVDNVFVERLWKSVKYEEVYLHAYDSVAQAKHALQRYFSFYNQRRPHSSLDGKTPDQVYFHSLSLQQAA